MSTVCFKISGEYITKQARTFVLEENWETALRLLNDDIQGSSYEIAVDVLTCKKQFVGINEVNLIDDDPALHAEYFKQVDYLYGGVYKRSNQYWRPYAIVTGYSELDMNRKAMAVNKYCSTGDIAAPIRQSAGFVQWAMARNTFYMNNMREDIAITSLKHKGKKHTVLWENIRCVPLWIKTYNSWQEALDNLSRPLDERGPHQYGPELEIMERRRRADIDRQTVDEKEEKERQLRKQENEADRSYRNMIDDYIGKIKKKKHTIEAVCGWLSPQGFLIECNYACHEKMGSAILKHFYNIEDTPTPGDDLIKRRWQKLQNKEWVSLHQDDFKVTQAQYSTMWDYSQLHKTRLGDLEIR